MLVTFCETHGYFVGWTYMDCSAFGVPSRRRHVLIFGALKKRLAERPGPILELFLRGLGKESEVLPFKRKTPCLPFRVVSQRHTLGFGQYVVFEFFNEGEAFRLRSFGLREVEFLLGLPPGYTDELPHTLADQAIADAFPPPAAEFLGKSLILVGNPPFREN